MLVQMNVYFYTFNKALSDGAGESHVVRKWKRKLTYDAKRIIVLLEIQKYLRTQIKHKKEHRIVFIVSQSRIK